MHSPPSSSRQVFALIATLRHQLTNPSLYICGAFHVVVVCEDLSIFDDHVLNRRVFEVLAQTANGYTIAAMYGDLKTTFSVKRAPQLVDKTWAYILNEDVVGSRLDSYCVVAPVLVLAVSRGTCCFHPQELEATQTCPWYTKLVSLILLASIVSNPSVFCTQLVPYGADRAVLLT